MPQAWIGTWNSSQSIAKLDNEQEILIRLSSWGIVAVDVLNNKVWSAFRIVKINFTINFGFLVHSTFPTQSYFMAT
jgi:hypothetical protein